MVQLRQLAYVKQINNRKTFIIILCEKFHRIGCKGFFAFIKEKVVGLCIVIFINKTTQSDKKICLKDTENSFVK